MAKQAISVTLDASNVTWLKGRIGPSGARSISDLLDQIVRAAREGRHSGPSTSVVGTIDIDAADPELAGADDAVRQLVAHSLARPVVVRERTPRYGTSKKRSARRG